MFKPTEYEADNIVLSFDLIYWTVAVEQIIDTITNGATRIITAKPSSLELQFQLIEKYKVTILYKIPFLLYAWLKSEKIHGTNLSSVKTIYMCGCKVPTDLVVDIKRYFINTNCVSWYGMSEFGRMFISFPGAKENSNGGQLLEGFSAKIIDENGLRCGPNVLGELCIKKKYKFLGYLDDPVANAVALDSEGFFHTGDIGHFDEKAFFFMGDRKKNIIFSYYFHGITLPSEVEEHLLSVSDIKEACVVGIPIAGHASLPAALIVRMPNSNLKQRDIYNFVAGKISANKS